MRIRIGLVVLLALFIVATPASAAIYWEDGAGVGRVNLDGTDPDPDWISLPPTSSYTGGENVLCGGIAIDESHIYWADSFQGTIGRANLDGTNRDYTFITGLDTPCGVAVNRTHIFWDEFWGMRVGRADLDGTNVSRRLIEVEYPLCGVAANDSHVFWGAVTFNFLGRADLDGRNVAETFIDDAGGGCGLAINDSHIFWSDLGDSIGRANLDGTNADRAFIPGLERPCGLALYNSQLYWSEQTYIPSGLLGRSGLDGASIFRGIATNIGIPCGIAVDSVFFPPDPLVPPAPRSHCSVLRTQYNTRRGSASLFVQAPTHAILRVIGVGLRWRIRYREPPLSVGGLRQRRLRIWPGHAGIEARRIRAQLRKRGRALIRVQITCHGRFEAPSVINKRVVLRKSSWKQASEGRLAPKT